MSGENIFDEVEDDDAVAVLDELLQKAKSGDDDGDDEDDEKTMKAMKRYMKKNPESMKKMMRAMLGDKAMRAMLGDKAMKKADDLDSLYSDIEAETPGAQMISLDGTEFFKAFIEFGKELSNTIDDLNDKVDALTERIEYSENLQKASGALLLESHSEIKRFGSLPQDKKSMTAMDINQAEMLQKAALQQPGQTPAVPAKGNEQQIALLQKAMIMPQAQISRALVKAAIKDNNVINEEAARVLSRFEAGGLMRLDMPSLQYIVDNVVSPQMATTQGGVQ